MRFPRIWVIPGNRPGDDAQVYALAEELGLPFETRKLVFNWRFWLNGKYMGASPISVERELREKTLCPPWPDLIILVGRRGVPVARWVQQQNGSRTRLVLVGHPRVAPDMFDLVYTTRQYRTPTGPSMRLQPLAMSRYRSAPKLARAERNWLDALPRPHLLLMLGGNTRHWDMRPQPMADVAERLAERARSKGGSLIVVRSARTPDDVLDAVERRLKGSRCEWRVVRHDMPSFTALLYNADELYPTADSISMISEAAVTGKPVGIVQVQRNWRGLLMLGGSVNVRSKKRDLRRFWEFVLDEGLVGTLEEPKASTARNPVVEAAEDVRELLERDFGDLPA